MSQLMKKRFPSITSIDVGSDGNTSFLRAARNGQLDKVLEHLKSNIDINTSNANGLNALHLASKDGHVDIVDELLKRGAVVDAATKKGNTALHIASLAGQEEVVKLLVAHGASVNVQSQNGFTPLYMAAQENHDNVVKYLLANGANQSLSTEDGFTPLAVAMQQGHDKVVTVLLENDTRGKVRLPALHIAAKKDDVKAAKLLLENEHNPDVTSKSGFTPLHIASHYGNQGIANLLVQKGADVNYAAKHNITPLHVAAKWGKTNMVAVLLEQGANIESKTRDGLTPLHCAARSGHEQVVDMLLEKGAPISSKTKNGLAPLHMAAQGDHVDAARILLYHRAPVDEVTVDYLTALHVAAHCGHVRVAKLLLDRQADANARALNGFTPLHIACKKNRIKVVELLLKHGASIGATTESGLTPLHVASFMGCMNIVIYLLQHDASPDVPTVRGETPLHLAARANQTDIIRILLRNGAQVDARAREQQTPLHIASRLGNVDIVMLLLQHGAQVDNATKDLYTSLHIAAKEGQDEVAAALIDNGASLNATTKKGFTPLHLAAKYGHLKVAKLLLQKEAPVDAQGKNGVTPLHVASHYDNQNVALLLLEKGASPYATAKNGHTPLHIAAKKNQMDIANTLLEYGAKPNAESKAGFTPLHLSAQEGHCDMSDLLIEHKADTNYTAKNGLAPLHLCAQEDKVSVAEILLRNGGQVDACTKNGYTPLHIASHYGQINMVRFLLANGADVKANTSLGYTPLHQAAQQGHTNIVNVLLENSAQPNALTNNGQTPLHIAQKLGYITVIDTLKVVSDSASPTAASLEEKYKVVAPEAMQETFMSDSEEEGGEDTLLGDQTYRYLTADEMKSLGDDSLPIDVTRDERIDSNRMLCSTENMYPPRHIEDSISPEHVQQNYVEYIKKFTPDNIDIDKHPINIGFLVSFLVDARGGAMRGCRHSGVRVIVPPRCASSPTRITCRYVRPQRTPHPPPLMEGEALSSRVLELGPVGAKFLGPVIIEVPHFAALRGKEREIVILRSDNGESWKEHTVEASEEVMNEVLHDSFDAEDLNQLEDISSGRITRIVTQDFPQYFAVVSRIRQEVHAIGPEGGMVSSTVVPQVQAVFPQGALTKKIKVGLQAQPIDPDLTAKLLGHGVAVSPVVTVEPRRRKFHKAITLSMPAPKAHSQGMINQYSGNTPTLRLLCSITGGTTRAQWEDVTGSTPLTFVNDCVSFTTTVSARFWLMDCRNVGDATKMATELYREAIHVPFMAKFVVFAKRVDPLEARLRVFCMTDDKEDKTLEHQEHFTEVAKSRDVEVLEGKPQYIEFAGNLVPITKSGEQLQFSFRAFRENRLPFSVRVKDEHAEAVSRCLFMREPKLAKGEAPQQPICILNIVLPDDIVVDTISLTDGETLKRPFVTNENFDYYRPDPRLADMSNLLGEDWVPLATQLGLTTSEINVIKSEYPDSVAKQAQSMLRMWLSQSGNKAQADTLESALRRIGREDIIPQCLNVDYGITNKEIGKQRLMKKTISLEQSQKVADIIVDSEIGPVNEHFDKYSAEEKIVQEMISSDEEDFNKTVTERRHQIEERLSVDRTVPASSQRVEIVEEITSIKRQSIVENKIAEVEQKSTADVADSPKTTIDESVAAAAERTRVEGARRDSELLEGVTQRFETTNKITTNIHTTEDTKSPKFSQTPPPSPADFISREQTATIQEWDATKKSASPSPPSKAPEEQPDAGQGRVSSTTTERLVASSDEERLLEKPVGQSPLLTGFSVDDKLVIPDVDTVLDQTNAFIQTESHHQVEEDDAIIGNEKKIDDYKNNTNEKKKAKKGFFGSIKTFVERSFESDSDSEKSPKKAKKNKKEKRSKVKDEEGLPPKKPKLPTPPLEVGDDIPFVETLPDDLPPPYRPPDIPTVEQAVPTTDLDGEAKTTIVEEAVIVEVEKVKSKKKAKTKHQVHEEEITKTIQPLVIESEEFSVVVDPDKKSSPKKTKETFTLNIDESIDKIEKEILEKSPILSAEKIVKPLVDLELTCDIPPVRPRRVKEHIYEDIEEPVVSSPPDHIVNVSERRVSYKEQVDEIPDIQQEVVEKQDKEQSKEKKEKGTFFGLFKKKDSKKEDESDREKLSEVVVQEMEDSQKFLEDEVQQFHDVRPIITQEILEEVKITEDVTEEVKVPTKEVEETKAETSGILGLFKKSRGSPEKKLKPTVTAVVSEEIIKDMTDTEQFVIDEMVVEEKSIVKEIEETKTESSGIMGFFKKSKKEEGSPEKKLKTEKSKKKESVERVLSEEVVKDMADTNQFLSDEVVNYHDVKPEVQKEEVEKIPDKVELETTTVVEEEKVTVEDSKTESGGILGFFKKTKKESSPEKKAKPDKVKKVELEKVLSTEVVQDMNESTQFLLDEVKNYHDVRPDVRKVEEEVEKIPDKVKDTTLEFSSTVKEEKPETKVVDEVKTESGGILGFFKKAKKEGSPEKKVKKPKREQSKEPEAPVDLVSKKEESIVVGQVVEDMEHTNKFLDDEVQNYHDVRPVIVPSSDILKEEVTIVLSEATDSPVMEQTFPSVEEEPIVEKVIEEVREASPKPSGGLFGLFKKTKKDEEPSEVKLSEEVLKDMSHTSKFLSEEVDKYHDVKPEKFDTIIIHEETSVESSPKQSRGLFGIFKKAKTDEEELVENVSEDIDQVVESKEVIDEILTVEVKTLDSAAKPEAVESLVQEVKTEIRESSPKPHGLLSFLRKSKDEPEVLENMHATNQFISDEVENYHDVKPDTFEPIKTVEEVSTASPKPSRGLFGIFRKSKDAPEEVKVALSETAIKEIKETDEFLTSEIEKHEDVKPETFESVVVVKETVTKISEDINTASPKPSRGLFGIFRKSKDEPEEVKAALSETVNKEIKETDEFLTSEVEKHEDVKPETFEPVVVEDTVTKVSEDINTASPKPSRGLFGIFRKSKDEPEEVKAALSETVIKEIKETDEFLTSEVEKHDDVKPETFESVVVVDTITKISEDINTASPKPSRGLFGIFRKSKDDPEDVKSAFSETVIKEIKETDEFLTSEVEKHEDVKPETFESVVVVEDLIAKLSEDINTASPKPSRGLFGMFKKSKKDEEETVEGKPHESSEEKEDLRQVPKPLQVAEEEVLKIVEEKKESSSRPSSGFFGLFKKTKNGDEESEDVEVNVEDVLKDTEFVIDETEKHSEVDYIPEMIKQIESHLTQTKEEVQSEITDKKEEVKVISENIQSEISETTEEIKSQALEDLNGEIQKIEEPKTGFLAKFKKTKKTQIEDCESFINTELTNYEDAKPVIVVKEVKKEKSVKFEEPEKDSALVVVEGLLPTAEVASEIEITIPVKDEVVEPIKEEIATETVAKLEEHETTPPKKGTKDKKGFFSKFGKKTKSQDTAVEESRATSVEERESSPKKQKRRKSSPFKFFDKKKSEEEKLEKSIDVVPEIKAEIEEESKDDLMTVEFDDQPTINLTDEVLQSLEMKISELKSNYSEETHKKMQDCQDFLFIEIDNYEDSQPIPITDIDKVLEIADNGFTEETAVAVDNLINETKKIVEDTADVVQTVISDETDKVEEVVKRPKKTEKKGDRKSGGFFSKLGNLISGSVEDTKNDLKEAKKSVEESTEKTIESATQIIEKTGDEIKDTIAVSEEKAAEPLQNGSEAISESGQKVEKTKDEFSDNAVKKLDDLCKEIESDILKARGKVDTTKEEVSEITVKAISDLKEKVDATATQKDVVVDVVKTETSILGDELQTIVDSLDQEIAKNKQDTLETLETTKAEATKVTNDVIHSAESKLNDIQEKTVEIKDDKLNNLNQTVQEIKEDDLIASAEETKNSAVDHLSESVKNIEEEKGKIIAETKEIVSKEAEAKLEAAKEHIDAKVGVVQELASQTKEEIKESVDKSSKAAKKSKKKLDKAAEDIAKETTGFFSKLGNAISGKSKDKKDKLAGKVKELDQQVTEKVDDVIRTKEDVETITTQKISDLKKDTEDTIEKSKKTVDETKQALNQNIESIVDEVKDTTQQAVTKAEDAIGSVKEGVSETKDELIKETQLVKEATKDLKDETISKVTAIETHISTKSGQVIDDIASTKDSALSALAQEVEDISKSVVTRTEELENTISEKAKVESAAIEKKSVKIVEEIVKEKDNLSDLAHDEIAKKKEILASTISHETDSLVEAKDDITSTVTETKQSASSAFTQELEDITKSVVAESKDFEKHISEKTKHELDDLEKKSVKNVEDIAKEKEHLSNLVQEEITQKKESLVGTISHQTDSLVKAKDEVVDIAQKEVKHIEEERFKLVQDVKDSTKVAVIEAKDVIQATTEKTILKTEESLSKLEQQIKDKKNDLTEDSTQVIQDTVKKTEESKEEIHDSIRKAEEEAGGLFSTISAMFSGAKEEVTRGTSKVGEELTTVKEDVSETLNGFKEQSAQKNDVLKDTFEHLITEPVKDHSSSYVTSPTMARRAVSQRYSTDSRPMVREVTGDRSEEDSDESERYTVVEPEEIDEEAPRKPLFHLESEEDDTVDLMLSRHKERRDSAKSNVLETLTDTRLDSLLSTLENQMVQDLENSVAGLPTSDEPESKLAEVEIELETITKDSQADVDQIEQKLRDLDKALDSLEQTSDPQLEKKLHRVERKFERMASEVIDTDDVSPTRRDNEFQRLVSQLSTEEVSDFQKEYSHLWDETTFSKTDEWDSKTPDSQVDLQDLPQGDDEVVYMGPVTLNKDNLTNKAGIEVDVIPIMRSPSHSPRPTKKNKRAKSAMEFYMGQDSPTHRANNNVEFDRGSLPDLKFPSKSGSLVSTIIHLNPERFLYGSTSSLKSTASSATSELSRGEIMNAVLDWLEQSNANELSSSLDSASIASSDSSLSHHKPLIPTIRVTKGKSKTGKSDWRGDDGGSTSTVIPHEASLKAEDEEGAAAGPGSETQARSVTDQHQISEEMRQLLQELEKESKQ